MRKIVVQDAQRQERARRFHPLAGEPVFSRPRALLGQLSGNGFVAEPFFSHRFAHERADTRRIRSAAYSDKIHFSPEVGLNDG